MTDTQTGDMFCADCGTNLRSYGLWLGTGVYCGRCYRTRIAEDPAPPQMPPTIIPIIGALEGGPMSEELRNLANDYLQAELLAVIATLEAEKAPHEARIVHEALRRLEAANEMAAGWQRRCALAAAELRRLQKKIEELEREKPDPKIEAPRFPTLTHGADSKGDKP